MSVKVVWKLPKIPTITKLFSLEQIEKWKSFYIHDDCNILSVNTELMLNNLCEIAWNYYTGVHDDEILDFNQDRAASSLIDSLIKSLGSLDLVIMHIQNLLDNSKDNAPQCEKYTMALHFAKNPLDHQVFKFIISNLVERFTIDKSFRHLYQKYILEERVYNAMIKCQHLYSDYAETSASERRKARDEYNSACIALDFFYKEEN